MKPLASPESLVKGKAYMVNIAWFAVTGNGENRINSHFGLNLKILRSGSLVIRLIWEPFPVEVTSWQGQESESTGEDSMRSVNSILSLLLMGLCLAAQPGLARGTFLGQLTAMTPVYDHSQSQCPAKTSGLSDTIVTSCPLHQSQDDKAVQKRRIKASEAVLKKLQSIPCDYLELETALVDSKSR